MNHWRITITSRGEAAALLADDASRSGFDGVISLEDPSRHRDPPLAGFGCVPHRLRLLFDDLGLKALRLRDPQQAQRLRNMGRVAPEFSHVQAIRQLAEDAGPYARLLIHCEAGVSRSTAAALIVARLRAGPDSEPDNLAELRMQRPRWDPNTALLHFADSAWGWQLSKNAR